MTTNIILQGVVGSHAYGLATEQSDVDTLGIYAAPTEWFFTLREPKGTIVTTKPDSALHEAKKFCQLALQCNPSVLELLWLTDYMVKTRSGRELIENRHMFLSRKRVRDAYLGYATQQLRRLEGTTGELVREVEEQRETADEKRRRKAKHARHLYRLTEQGLALWTHGTFNVKVSHPDRVHAFGEAAADGDTEVIRQRLRVTEDLFNTLASPLPEQPDTHRVEMWLLDVRTDDLRTRNKHAEIPA